MEITDFLNGDLVKTALKNNDLNAVYKLYYTYMDSSTTCELSKFLMGAGIKPWEYFKDRVPYQAFFEVSLKEPIKLNNSIKCIGAYAFAACELEDFQIDLASSRIEQISSCAFAWNDIEYIELPSTIKQIDANSFDAGVVVYISESCRDEILENFGFEKPRYIIEWI